MIHISLNFLAYNITFMAPNQFTPSILKYKEIQFCGKSSYSDREVQTSCPAVQEEAKLKNNVMCHDER
jgi:hypothetical protein